MRLAGEWEQQQERYCTVATLLQQHCTAGMKGELSQEAELSQSTVPTLTYAREMWVTTRKSKIGGYKWLRWVFSRGCLL